MPDAARSHSIVVVGETSHAAELFAAGLTLAEIAVELGITESAAASLPELANLRIGQAHVARLEQVRYTAAVVGQVETVTRTEPDGSEVVTVKQYPPDMATNGELLAALAPDRYGKAAPPVAQPAINISVAFITPDHRHTGATIDASPIPAALGNGDPGGGALLASGGGVEAGTGTSPVSDFSKT